MPVQITCNGEGSKPVLKVALTSEREKQKKTKTKYGEGDTWRYKGEERNARGGVRVT